MADSPAMGPAFTIQPSGEGDDPLVVLTLTLTPTEARALALRLEDAAELADPTEDV